MILALGHRKRKAPQLQAELGLLEKRRAWDSNPQPLAGHLISRNAVLFKNP
jgi:hypothetical protein